ncbi:MAG TPA: protein-disulfide reductase DsbD N-terminal domain-containing protein [Nevskiaceae bacterium]|nr:protein-disulfide reductase DsbD N-terminal domain-containing protein [Nevskiaceae bacterium]
MKLRAYRILPLALFLACAGAANAAGVNWLDSASAGKLLPAAQAFVMAPPAWHGQQITLRWTIAPGYYLYRNRIKVHPAHDATAVGKLELPPATEHEEAGIGIVHIYRGTLEARYRPAPGSAPPRGLVVTVQGCADRGVCYPPLTRTVSIQPASVGMAQAPASAVR